MKRRLIFLVLFVLVNAAPARERSESGCEADSETKQRKLNLAEAGVPDVEPPRYELAVPTFEMPEPELAVPMVEYEPELAVPRMEDQPEGPVVPNYVRSQPKGPVVPNFVPRNSEGPAVPNGETEDMDTGPAVPVDDAPPEDAKCYFEENRLPKDLKENKFSATGDCKGKLISMRFFFDAEFDGLYGASNQLDLMVARGEGKYDIDWSNEAVANSYLNSYICERHSKTLGRDFSNQESAKFPRKRVDSRILPACSVPLAANGHGTMVLAENRYLEKDEAEQVAKKYKVHIPVGSPLCRKHKDEFRFLAAEATVSSQSTQFTQCSSGSSELDVSMLSIEERLVCEVSTEVLSTFDSFAKALKLDHYKVEVEFSKLPRRSQNRRLQTGKKIVETTAQILAPGEAELFLSRLMQPASASYTPSTEEFEKMSLMLVQWHQTARHIDEAKYALSIISHTMPFAAAAKLMPDLTQYNYYDAKRRYVDHAPVLRETHTRERWNREAVDLFVTFITSPVVTTGLPFGSVTAHLADGSAMELPGALRSLTHTSVIHAFTSYVKETGQEALLLSNSSYFRLLSKCPASHRLQRRCVSYLQSEGEQGFSFLDDLLKKMEKNAQISTERRKELGVGLHEAEQYLKLDFRVHLKDQSRIGDHCAAFALSDPNDEAFKAADEEKPGGDETDDSGVHLHEWSCDRCLQVLNVLDDIVKEANTVKENLEEQVEATTDVEQKSKLENDLLDAEDDVFLSNRAVKDIKTLKAHFVRAYQSDVARHELIDSLQENEALVTVDYSMKVLPMRHVESQRDFFGQRGMSLHISHVLVNSTNGRLQQRAFLHAFDHDSQDSSAVTSIIKDLLQRLQQLGIRRVVLRSDNAAPYKCTSTIVTLQQMASTSSPLDLQVSRWSFSETQHGKDAADRVSSKVKRRFRTFVNEARTNNILSAEDMLKALDHPSVKGITAIAATVERPTDKPAKLKSLNGIQNFHEFIFESTGNVKVFKHYEIGVGKSLSEVSSWAGKENKASLAVTKVIGFDETQASNLLYRQEFFVDVQSGDLGTKDNSELEAVDVLPSTSDGNDEEDQVHTNSKLPTTYSCPISGCMARFTRYRALEKHVEVGKHKLRPAKCSLVDYTIKGYGRGLEKLTTLRMYPQASEAISRLRTAAGEGEKIEMGWALPSKKEVKRHSKKVVAFLTKLYDDGAKSGRKVEPKEVVRMMRATENGQRKFDHEDWLTESQIISYFSVLHGKKQDAQVRRTKKEADAANPSTDPFVDEVMAFLDDYEGDYEEEARREPLYPQDAYEAVYEIIEKVKNEIFIT